jgi:hypothetical protein
VGKSMSIWNLLLILEMALCAVVMGFLFLAWRRKARGLAKAHSPEHRLKIPNVWTEMPHLKRGTCTQMMRMKDGNFIMLSVGPDFARVSVGPQFDSIESFAELASFPLGVSESRRRQHQAIVLADLKTKIGFPQSVSELRQKAQALCPPGNRTAA